MYTERHFLQNRYTRGLQWAGAAIALWQLAALIGAETGLPWLPLGYVTHLMILLIAACLFVLVSNAGFNLRVSQAGWELRRPGRLFYQQIAWTEIKKLQIVHRNDLPTGWEQKTRHNAFGQVFLVSNPRFEMVRIDLTTGVQVYVSVQQPGELMAFLHNSFLQGKIREG